MDTFLKGYLRKRHGKWTLVLKYRDDKGEVRMLTKATDVDCGRDGDNRTGRAKAERLLMAWRDELVRENASNLVVEGGMPLGEYLAWFLGNKNLKTHTIEAYRSWQRRIDASGLGSIPINEVTPTDIINFEGSLYADGLSACSVNHAHVLLAQVFKHAKLAGDITKNPIALVKAPKVSRRAVNSLTREGMVDVMATLAEMGPEPISVAGRLALLCGMRRGELCGLRWMDVDPGSGLLHVSHSLECATNQLVVPKDPAGGNSTRTIPITAGLRSVLDERRRECESHARGMCRVRDTDYVLGSPLNGKPYSPDALSREWRMLAKVHGWRGMQGDLVRFHDLRHSFATHAVASGMDVMSLAAVLGHRNPSTTLDIYAIALDDPKRDGLDRVASLLGGDRWATTRQPAG